MPRIQSRDNPRLKEAARLLASARERRKSARCVLEGVHLVAAFLDRGGEPDWLIVDDAALARPEVRRLVAAVDDERVLVAPSELFAQTTHVASPAHLLAVAATPHPGRAAGARFVLLLEEIQDPGNVGTILRSAAAAGVGAVHLSKGCAFAWSPKVLRAGQGAHFHLQIHENADLCALARTFDGAVYATVVSAGTAVFDADLRGPVAFAVGGEGAGLSRELIESSGAALTVPMPGGFESLNAAVATSICLFEKVRQERAG
jgi:TrmH family RNA methyltransferase